jgi:hypothetical protein
LFRLPNFWRRYCKIPVLRKLVIVKEDYLSNGDETRLVEQRGIGVFTTLSGEFGGLVRQTNTHDKGIDAELEVTNSFSFGEKTPILVSLRQHSSTS